MAEVTLWNVLTQSPFELFNRHESQESFFDMLKNFLAPYYKLKSLTTILLAIIIIVYIILACPFPPFLRIPTFQLEPLILRP